MKKLFIAVFAVIGALVGYLFFLAVQQVACDLSTSVSCHERIFNQMNPDLTPKQVNDYLKIQ